MTFGVFEFIALAILCNTLNKILNRYIAKDTSPFAFSWLTQVVASILFLPLALKNLSFPVTPAAYVTLIVAGIVWTLVSLSVYISTKKTEVSVREPLSQSKLIWTLLLGLLLLGESATPNRIIGTLIIFVGMGIVVFHPERRFGNLLEPGVLWTLASAVLSAIIAIVDKFALGFFRPELYGFLVYLIPGIILSCFLPRKIKDVKHLWCAHGKIAVLTILISTAAYYFTLKAFSLADVTIVFPLLQLATIFAVIAGILFLGEKEHKWQKIVASILVVTGAIVINIL